MRNSFKSIAFLILFAKSLFAQTPSTLLMEKDLVRRIEVTGTAEMEVVPDQITINITLKEYFKDEKTQKDKVTIDILEKQLIKAVTEAGLPKESLVIGGINGYREYVSPRKKPINFTQSKSYELLVNDLKKIDNIFSKIDEKGLQNTYIQKTEHSRISQFKKEIKTKALQAAKEKAQYLLEGIGEKLGEAIEINEMEDYSNYPVYAQANVMYKAMDAAPEAAAGGLPDSTLDYQKIKISYKMRAVFRIAGK